MSEPTPAVRAITQRREKLTARQEREAYEIVTLRDDNVCQFRAWDCAGAVQRDHRQNRDAYNTVPSNLQLLCAKHHQWKTEHPEDALRDGWAVLRHTELNPADWPAARWFRNPLTNTFRRAWVLYTDDGNFVEITESDARYRQRRGGLS